MSNPICTYGNPVLRMKAHPVEKVTEELRKLTDRMLSQMYSAEGIGLAAEQIGRTEALFVIDIPPRVDQNEQGNPNNPGVTMPLVVFDPKIIGVSDETDKYEEGCLSLPGIQVNVTRPKEVVLSYLDRSGTRQMLKAKGLLARAIQHENDHLNGILLVDHMSAAEKMVNFNKLNRLKRQNKQGK